MCLIVPFSGAKVKKAVLRPQNGLFSHMPLRRKHKSDKYNPAHFTSVISEAAGIASSFLRSRVFLI